VRIYFLKSLKAKNILSIWAVLLSDAVGVLALTFPTITENVSASAGAFLRSGLAAVAPVVVFLLTSLLPPHVKAVLVFWRIRDALPGHRAFSLYAFRDPRIDIESLKKNVGQFPDSPRDQNSLWYRLFKKVEGEEAVALAHRQFLLFRDLASISILLIAIAPALLYALGVPSLNIGIVIALFLIQYSATAIAARNHGERLVTNVLAVHSTKPRVR
jgi:hypothetical protein